MKELENSTHLNLDFNRFARLHEKQVLPVVVQNIKNNEVIFVAFINREALQLSIKTKVATFFSLSRNELWIKGKTSGDTLFLKEIRVNCEQNSLLFLVNPKTDRACHTKNSDNQNRKNCYYRKLREHDELSFLD